jgi:hypothetical protein
MTGDDGNEKEEDIEDEQEEEVDNSITIRRGRRQ